jgi:hypothetical protein
MSTENTITERIETEGGDVYCLKNSASGTIIGFFKTVELARKQAESVERGIAFREYHEPHADQR